MTVVEDGKLRAQRTWGDSPTGIGTAEGLKPGTREHFERSLKWRSEVEQPWLTEVAPFREWAGKKVLEVGHGPGYDAYSILKAGADYSGVDLTPENIVRTRQALACFGLKPKVQEGDAEALPFPADTFDVVYSNGVLHHCPDIAKTFAEACRVLKPGGRFHVILYHRDGVFYWLNLFLWFWLIHGDWRRVSFAERVREIEWNRVGEKPIVNVYSRSEVTQMLRAAGFDVAAVKVRKLTAADLPQVWVIHRLFKFVPGALYRAAGKLWGWYVCAEGVKA